MNPNGTPLPPLLLNPGPAGVEITKTMLKPAPNAAKFKGPPPGVIPEVPIVIELTGLGAVPPVVAGNPKKPPPLMPEGEKQRVPKPASVGRGK
eukprot:5014262-Amphidinium_carterae.1